MLAAGGIQVFSAQATSNQEQNDFLRKADTTTKTIEGNTQTVFAAVHFNRQISDFFLFFPPIAVFFGETFSAYTKHTQKYKQAIIPRIQKQKKTRKFLDKRCARSYGE